MTAPAPTVTGMNTACEISDVAQWQGDRTQADRAAGRPGQRKQERGRGRQMLVSELAVLQTFPEDYPWQGKQSEQHRQMGNAVPPLLARACIAEALGLEQA
jgi:DNA (cytosine-5)-methyltransferase 1